MELPKNSILKWREDSHSVDEDEQFICIDLIKTANTDGPLAGGNPSNIYPGDETQRFGDICHTGASNVFLREYVDSRCHLRKRLLLLSRRSHRKLHIEKLFETDLCQILGEVLRHSVAHRRT